MSSGAACIVLAGGQGTRLRSVVADVPKCLAPVDGQPFLMRQLDSLAARGVGRFVLALGHQAALVQSAAAGWPLRPHIEWVVEPAPLGTGGAIVFAMRETGLTEALVANGDTFLGGDLSAMLTPLAADEAVRMSVVTVPDRGRFGGVSIDAAGRVERFLEKGAQGPGPVNAGFYRVRASALPRQTDTSFSFETAMLPTLAQARQLSAVQIDGDFIDIGVPQDYWRYCEGYGRLR